MKKYICLGLALVAASVFASGSGLLGMRSTLLESPQATVQAAPTSFVLPTIVYLIHGGASAVGTAQLTTVPTGLHWLGAISVDAYAGLHVSNTAPVAGIAFVKTWTWALRNSPITITPTVGLAIQQVQSTRPNGGFFVGLSAGW